MKTYLLALMILLTPYAFAETLYFANGSLLAETSWVIGPRVGPASQMQIFWKNAADLKPVEFPGVIRVILWMSMEDGHGHGSRPTEVKSIPGSPGLYLVDKMYFMMTGHWEVQVELTYANGQKETVALPVTL